MAIFLLKYLKYLINLKLKIEYHQKTAKILNWLWLKCPLLNKIMIKKAWFLKILIKIK